MPKLQRLRTEAFLAQKGRCCYCSVPMWNASPDELKPFGLRAKTATPLRCTAEHLIAKQEGGKDVAGNIAAACWLCNTRRHKRKSPPSPEAYWAFVQKRLAKGKWHPPGVAKLRVKPPQEHQASRALHDLQVAGRHRKLPREKFVPAPARCELVGHLVGM